MNIIKVNTYQQLVKNIASSSRPSVIKFTAKTCKPCKHFNENFLSSGFKIDVYDVEFSENKAIAKLYNVRVLPTAILINKMQPVERMNGLKEYDEFIEFVENVMPRVD